MRYIDEFRNKSLANKLSRAIFKIADKNRGYNIMEVCGTHTMNIFKFGIRRLIPENVELLSGPGCPVCVTETSFIDKAIEYSKLKDIVITTFGDMFRVPGSQSSLDKERAKGSRVKVVYSCSDALNIARENPKKMVIFLGIGFETTIPTVAVCVLEAAKLNLRNFYILCGHKTMPPALLALTSDERLNVDGFMLPGHVSTIIGKIPYEFLAKEFNRACVIAGFEPLDILEGIYMLIKQINKNRKEVEIQYKRVVKQEGNKKALDLIKKVFEKADSNWRGIGVIRNSGLKLKRKFLRFDAEENIKIDVQKSKENKACICGEVLKGLSEPLDCKLFAGVCTPHNPIGACMVSSEGTCAAYYKYR